MRLKHLLFLFLLLTTFGCREDTHSYEAEILIIGGGASGTMAAIQSARMGAQTLLVEETPWLGGMMTSAGVSAIDGNYRLQAGLWEEFRQRIYAHYGGPDSVRTGWVSQVMFEPHVAASILDNMTAEVTSLKVVRRTMFNSIEKVRDGWVTALSIGDSVFRVKSRIVIDATELGDVAGAAGIPYDIGMDSRDDTGEAIAPTTANNIIQDLTYVAILKDFGDSRNHFLDEPPGYDPQVFRCTCAGYCVADTLNRRLWDCSTMMNYGKLPNGYYMINWPIYGNDYYVNIIDAPRNVRQDSLDKAKLHTLKYVYYLQHELGYSHLGLADDVFPTVDNLPLIPYYRESRRIHGLVQFTLNDLANPFDQQKPLYRTGIAVGDYPVDHHHDAYMSHDRLPDLHFYPVPSYSLPLGCLIPTGTNNFIVAEKSISVTNLVNGTTRLQPVCLLVGQAAGALAAISIQLGLSPEKVPVRMVQEKLLENGAFLMPYSDISIDDPAFAALQRIGSTGILQGEGKNIGWENHTSIYPDSVLTWEALKIGLRDWENVTLPVNPGNVGVSLRESLEIIRQIGGQSTIEPAMLDIILTKVGLGTDDMENPLKRKAFAVLLDELADPFSSRPIDHRGHFID